jgi:hypothetical protein
MAEFKYGPYRVGHQSRNYPTYRSVRYYTNAPGAQAIEKIRFSGRGHASPTGRHERLPAARAGHVIISMARGHESFVYLQYTTMHADPDLICLSACDLRSYCKGDMGDCTRGADFLVAIICKIAREKKKDF